MSGPTPDKAKLGCPDRWMYCPKTGSLVENLFFPFKTPLCALYDDQIEKKLRFHPTDVFSAVKGKTIGLWIDLTKTDRYYSPQEVESRGCKYRKMALAGHGATPTVDETDRFIRLVSGFHTDNPDKIIAIHCTHGFNRTGFLICAYLIQKLDWAVDACLQMFARKRPCGIYKQDYINELYERYEGETIDVIEAPPRPSWEFNEAGGMQDDNSAVNGTGAGTSQNQKPGKVFMEGKVRGAYLLEDQTKKKMLQGKIRELCHYKFDGFPGSQPVSMERSPVRDNMKFLEQAPYMVSWKADGMRYMVYICDEDEIYAFDRDNEVFHLTGISFPHRKEARHVRNTLIDAEMIIEHIRETGVERPRLLMYDIIHFEEFPVGKQSFDIRRECMKRELIQPRTKAQERGLIRNEPMSIRVKEFWELCAVHKIFEPKFTQSVNHEIDGLIFQPVNEAYKSGRQDTVLKWKPPSHNSIDFKLQIRKVVKESELPQHVGFLYVQHSQEPMCTMKATKSLQPYDGKIIECSFENGQWKFMRERTDKSLPNSIKTAHAVWNSMQYPISQEALCDFTMKKAFRRKIPNLQQPCNPPPAKRVRV